MKKTLILYTGGTLGMRRSASGYVPDAHLESALQRLLEDTVDQLPQVDFQTLEPLLDSADMQPQDWYRIAAEIHDNYNHYTGFVVLHGTDTMAYTASALSFALQGLDKPVLVTGSQIPLREMRSDAYNNLIAALLLSGSEDIKEVCLYFSGKLLRGNRAVKVSSGSLDAFASPNYPSLGEVGIQVSVDPNVLLDPVNSPQFQTPESADGKVVLVKLFPGISPLFLSKLVEYRPRGLVIETYGTGNAPTNNAAFTAQLKTAAEAGIICVAVSQCLENQVDLGKYATGSALLRSGVVSGLDMTSIACFAKLNHLLAMRYSADEIKILMGTSLCGECTPLYR
ncbi:type I asparaginase [Microbulbifer sp. 2205BS26-8]|uniref:type I asparaginase n=1 Tax=Microbulbifer sp. 2205BS26-8 TaxID=3064386 RepID=UPI00273FEFC9|nr:type I asparaginase [Microbulbifer sp. 2205BS26-8]MDP5210635.1 type I asparaginase [Microbulbifer sp. 2205BS26-8]